MVEKFVKFKETILGDSSIILGDNLEVSHSFEDLSFLVEPFFAKACMDSLFEYELDIVLRVCFHVSDKVEVVDTSHEVVFEGVKLGIDFLLEFFESDIKIDMIKPEEVVDLVAVDELGEFGLFLLHEKMVEKGKFYID